MTDTANVAKYKWQFKPRFRRHAFGWRSQPAIERIKEATSEIKIKAAVKATLEAEVRARIRQVVGDPSGPSIVQAIGREFGF